MAALPTLHTLDYPAWAAFCPPAAPTDGLELMRNKAWAGLLCPKLLQRAPGKRHHPHQSTHRDPKTQQGQTEVCHVGEKLCCQCSLTSGITAAYSTPPFSKLLLHFPLLLPHLPASLSLPWLCLQAPVLLLHSIPATLSASQPCSAPQLLISQGACRKTDSHEQCF